MASSTTYSGPGTYSHSIGSSTTAVRIEAWGGKGGGGGGRAGYVAATFDVSELTSDLDITVGGDGGTAANSGGYNGGGDPGDDHGAGGGGGKTTVRPDGAGFDSSYVVAGGGGGGGYVFGPDGGPTGGGGDGGYPEGDDGQDATQETTNAGGGGGGTQSSGGSGGPLLDGDGETGSGGSHGSGGNGSNQYNSENEGSGGGGGAGWYGGGGGASESTNVGGAGAGGGGGSGYVASAGGSITGGAQSTSEQVVITELEPSASNLTTTYVGASEADLDWTGEDAEEYEVERDGEVIATVTTTTYTDTTISQNTTHNYQVYALQGGTRQDSTSTLDVLTGGPPASISLTQNGYDHTVTTAEPNGDYDELRLYRTNTTTSLSQIDSVLDASSYSYSETVQYDGLKYTYEARAVYPRAGETSGVQETGVATPMPDPSELRVTAVRADEQDLAWVLNNDSNGSGGVRLHRSRDDGQTWTAGPDHPAGTESATSEQLRHGEQYRWAVEVFTADASTVTAPGLKSP